MRKAIIAAILVCAFGILIYLQTWLWRLQEENRALKTQRGDLTLKDPTKINARLVFTDGKNHWRWRVHLPSAAKCQISFLFLDAPPAGKAELLGELSQKRMQSASGMLQAGEYTFELETFKNEADGIIETCLYWPLGTYPCGYAYRGLGPGRDTVDNSIIESDVGPETSVVEFGQQIVLFRSAPRKKAEDEKAWGGIVYGVTFEDARPGGK